MLTGIPGLSRGLTARTDVEMAPEQLSRPAGNLAGTEYKVPASRLVRRLLQSSDGLLLYHC